LTSLRPPLASESVIAPGLQARKPSGGAKPGAIPADIVTSACPQA
jgi:hypothetical protein